MPRVKGLNLLHSWWTQTRAAHSVPTVILRALTSLWTDVQGATRQTAHPGQEWDGPMTVVVLSSHLCLPMGKVHNPHKPRLWVWDLRKTEFREFIS